MNTRTLALFLATLTTSLIPGCGHDSGSGPGDDAGAGYVYSYPYTANGGTLTIIDSVTYCSGTTLVTRRDTAIITATVSDTLLTLVRVDTFGSGAIVVDTQDLRRQESGSGLAGRWVLRSDRRAVLSGTPSPAGETLALKMDSTLADSMASRGLLLVTITAGRISARYQGSLVDLLLPFALADAPGFRVMRVDTLSATSVRLTGSISGEVVTISFDGRLNQHYVSSSRALHPDYSVWRIPEECRQHDAWFADFLAANVSFADEYDTTYLQGLVFAGLDAAVQKQGYDTVVVTGNLTSEVVTIWYDGMDSVTFQSNATLHSLYRTGRQVTMPPDWWRVFCQDNSHN